MNNCRVGRKFTIYKDYRLSYGVEVTATQINILLKNHIDVMFFEIKQCDNGTFKLLAEWWKKYE